ncbi:hypothetical protein QNM99_11735 [Pseudomonas sp. PCH446]
MIFAMASSFILSRTLVPTLAMFLLKPHVVEGGSVIIPKMNSSTITKVNNTASHAIACCKAC